MGGANPAPMEAETRAERWLDRAIARDATPRGGAMVNAAITTSATVGFAAEPRLIVEPDGGSRAA